MSTVHPAFAAHQRQCWLRPDAHLFIKPDLPRWKTYAARLVELRQLEEKQAIAAEREALLDDLERPRWLVRDLKIDLAIRRLRVKYSPDQPRDERGRWTDVDDPQTTRPDGESGFGANAGMAGSPSSPPKEVLSDASPDPIVPGAQYAQRLVEINPSALTGQSQIDEKTRALAERLAAIADTVPLGMGPLYGTTVHGLFRADLSLGSNPGIEVADLDPTFGGTGLYGSKGSVRPDIVLRNESGDIVAIYDVKTGTPRIGAPRADEFRTKANVGIDTPLIELHVTKGVSIMGSIENRSQNLHGRGNWQCPSRFTPCPTIAFHRSPNGSAR